MKMNIKPAIVPAFFLASLLLLPAQAAFADDSRVATAKATQEAAEDAELKDYKPVSLCEATDNFDFFIGPMEESDPNIGKLLKGTRLPYHGKNYKYKIGLSKLSVKYLVKEEKRDSRFEDDLKTLFTIIPKLKDSREVSSKSNKIPCIEYTQQHKRSTITIHLATLKTKQEGGASPQAAKKADPAAEATGSSVITTKRELVKEAAEQSQGKTEAEDESFDKSSESLVAGPREIFYLTADMPVSQVKQVQYDKASNTVTEKDTPSTFYFGFNITPFGDAATNYRADSVLENLSLKLLAKASSRPSESTGIGIGYRLSMFDFFVAHMRTQDDPNVSSGGATSSTAYGISFNISKAVDWMTSNSSN